MEAVSDAALARAAAAHDSEAMGELYRRLAPRVRAYGLRHLGDDARADDLVQTVMLTALGKLSAGEVREPERFTSFVLGTCRRVVADSRKSEARRTALLAEVTPQLRELATTWTSTALLDRDQLTRCLEQLLPRQMTVIMLSFYAERTGSEIAEELATSPANVRVLRHRAIASLHDCITGATQ